MKNSVKIATHPVTGEVVTPSKNNPEYGTLRVEESGLRISNGFANAQRRSAFIRGKIKDLSSLTAGMELPGKIVAKETREPQFEGQSPKINPSTSEVILVDGAQVFLSYEYTEDSEAKDQLIKAGAEKAVLA
jgi:hypothetical protein